MLLDISRENITLLGQVLQGWADEHDAWLRRTLLTLWGAVAKLSGMAGAFNRMAGAFPRAVGSFCHTVSASDRTAEPSNRAGFNRRKQRKRSRKLESLFPLFAHVKLRARHGLALRGQPAVAGRGQAGVARIQMRLCAR